MPLIWKRGDNPYRVNYFGILGIGPIVPPAVVAQVARNIVAKIEHGAPHIVGGRAVAAGEVNEAASRLFDERHRAAELLLVHAVPASEGTRLREVCRAIVDQTAPPRSLGVLQLTNLCALAPLLPEISADDISWPEWEEFCVPGPESSADRRCDVQFDL